jgi:hypothetical protein
VAAQRLDHGREHSVRPPCLEMVELRVDDPEAESTMISWAL